jgi:DNA-binding Lrp family transcriptional regulator
LKSISAKNSISNEKRLKKNDFLILDAFNNNGRESLGKIADKTRISKSTISYRIRKLTEDGDIIFKPLINRKKFGLISALLFLQLKDVKLSKKLYQHWLTCPFVLKTSNLIGWDYTIQLSLIAPKKDDFQTFVSECPNLNTKSVLKKNLVFIQDNNTDTILDHNLFSNFQISNIFNSLETICGETCETCSKVWKNYLE